jgi:hypothetical protein
MNSEIDIVAAQPNERVIRALLETLPLALQTNDRAYQFLRFDGEDRILEVRVYPDKTYKLTVCDDRGFAVGTPQLDPSAATEPSGPPPIEIPIQEPKKRGWKFWSKS